jgi:UDP-galactose transporter B1
MILGVILARKRYPIIKYLFVVMITTGVALFMYRDEESGKSAAAGAYGNGEALLVSLH